MKDASSQYLEVSGLRKTWETSLTTGIAIATLPILLTGLFASAVAHKNPVPIYKDQRVGLNGEVFEAYKIQSYKPLIDANGNILSSDERLTPVGKILRLTSADELPQLWMNILILNNMSLFGPRPLNPKTHDDEILYDEKRISALPGVLGYQQAMTDSNIDDPERLLLDWEYLERKTIMFDWAILLGVAYNKIAGAIFGFKGEHVNTKTIERLEKLAESDRLNEEVPGFTPLT